MRRRVSPNGGCLRRCLMEQVCCSLKRGHQRVVGSHRGMPFAECPLVYKCDGCREMLRLTMGVDVASIDAIMPDLVHGIGYTPTDTAH